MSQVDQLARRFEALPEAAKLALWNDYTSLMSYDLEGEHCYHELFLAMRDGELLSDANEDAFEVSFEIDPAELQDGFGDEYWPQLEAA